MNQSCCPPLLSQAEQAKVRSYNKRMSPIVHAQHIERHQGAMTARTGDAQLAATADRSGKIGQPPSNWLTVSKRVPTRPNGKPSCPLTVFNVSIEPG